MLTTLLQIASDSSISSQELIQELITDSAENAEPTVILFLAEIWTDVKNTKRLMAPFMPYFSYLEEIEYQSSSIFFASHFTKIRENNLRFVGFAMFESWCQEIELLFAAPSRSKAKKTSPKPVMTRAMQLKAACKTALNITEDTNNLLCQHLYTELRSLALSGTYVAGKKIRVTAEASQFNIEQKVGLMRDIELLLEKYRAWMLTEKLIDPGVSDLSSLGFTESTSANGLHRTHIVCHPNANFPPNVLHYFRKIADEIIIVENKSHSILPLLQTNARFNTLHQQIQSHEALGEKFAKAAIPYMTKQDNKFIQNFIIKTIGGYKHFPFIALIKYANLENSAENTFVENLLGKLGDYVFDNTSTETTQNFIARIHMYDEILDFLAEKQCGIKSLKQYDNISNLIFSLGFLFIDKALHLSHENHDLYSKAFRIFKNTEIKNVQDIKNIQHVLQKIQNSVLIKTNALADANAPEFEQRWNMISDLYCVLIHICSQAKNCPECSFTATKIFQLEKNNAAYYSRNDQKHLAFQRTLFCHVLICFINDIAYAEKAKIFLTSLFFEHLFDFISKNLTEPFWHTPTNKSVFLYLIDLIHRCITHSFSTPQDCHLAPFPWEKLTSLFKKQLFVFSEKEEIIVNAIKDLGIYAASSLNNSYSAAKKKLTNISTLRQELEKSEAVYANSHSSIFYRPEPNIRYNAALPLTPG